MVRIYVAMQDGLAVFSRHNGDWELKTRLEGLPTHCVAIDLRRPERVYCGTFGHGLWRSANAGATWEPAGEGIVHPQVMAVAVGLVEGGERAGGQGEYGVVYAGAEPSALFRSEDGGQTWQELPALRALPSAPTWSFPPRPSTHHIRWIEPDLAVAGRLFVAIEQGGVMRSEDSGRTFEDRQPDGPRDAHTLATHRQAPGRLCAAAGDGLGAPGREFAESDDGGATWRRASTGIEHHYLWSVAVDPGNPDNVVTSGAHSPRQAHDPTAAESTIYYRHADGIWREARVGLPEPKGTVVPVLAANQGEPGIFYAASNKGIYRSPDAGRTWERLDVPWPARYRMQHVQGLAVVGEP